jgi:type IV secretory pathway VirB6-like protein
MNILHPRLLAQRAAPLGLLMVLALAGLPAHASIADGYNTIGQFQGEIITRVSTLINDPGSQVRFAATRFFFVMALALFVWKAASWALRGFDIADFFFTCAQILSAGALMVLLPSLLPAMFNATLFIGNALLAGLAGVSSASVGQAQLPIALTELFQRYTFEPECGPWAAVPGGCLFGNFAAVLASISTAIVVTLLGIAALLVDIWGFWGFAIALAIGMVFVPFMLYQRLAFLFDGWVRFTMGFLVYTIVARVNLALVAVALLTYQGATVAGLLGGGVAAPVLPKVESFADVLGMLLFATVGVFTLGATGTFARSMVMGAGGGGVQFSAVARNAASFVAGTASGLVTAGGGALAAGRAAAKDGGGAGAVAKAAAGGAAGSSIDAARKGNAAFASGYTVGREAAAGAIAGAARGVKIGADPKTPTGGGTPQTAQQRVQGVLGGLAGGAAAAAKTTAALSLGLGVKDSFAEKRALAEATGKANEVGFRAAEVLAREDNKFSAEQNREISQSLDRLYATMDKSKSADEVREATQAVRDALRGESSAAPATPDTAAPAPADAKVDPELAAAYRELDNDERSRYGGLTFQEYMNQDKARDAENLAAAYRELDEDERSRYGGLTFNEYTKAQDRQFKKDVQDAYDELSRADKPDSKDDEPPPQR